MFVAGCRDQWQAVVNVVIKFWVPYIVGELIDWLSNLQLTKRECI